MPTDPFREARRSKGVLRCPFPHGKSGGTEEIPMLLRHQEVRESARDWKTFSSDSPFRVPIPSEEKMRSMRQLPIETDPPIHTEYRALVAPFFNRSKRPEVIAKVESMIDNLLNSALSQDEVEIVTEFALPIQCRALTYLLDVPETEAETFVQWGIHVFSGKGDPLETYLSSAFDKALESPGDDFFSALTKATFQGRPLTREEMMGFANLTFAGGRDTIIHTLSSVVAYFADHQEKLDQLRGNKKEIVLASEEFFRVFMPLTQIGRVCPAGQTIHDEEVESGERIALGWAAANFDEEVFDSPEEVRLDRKPNPHISFGSGPHLCLGAPHARLITRTAITLLAEKVANIELIEATPHVEKNPTFTRENGFTSLRAKLIARP